jgi:hypothetical protein
LPNCFVQRGDLSQGFVYYATAKKEPVGALGRSQITIPFTARPTLFAL